MRSHLLAAAFGIAALIGACVSRMPIRADGGATAPDSGMGGALGEAGITGTGIGGGDGGGGGTGGGAGSGGVPDCPGQVDTGQPCTPGAMCTPLRCEACSDSYWRRAAAFPPCVCEATGFWMCRGTPGGPIGDCFFDPPLDCETAQSLYEDADCQTHPACQAAR